MIGLDTNVLVRYIMRDDARQAAKADALIEGLTRTAPGFVPMIVVAELVWVLESNFELPSADVSRAVKTLLGVDSIVVESQLAVAAATRRYSAGGVDFADALIAEQCRISGCEAIMTFDRNASKHLGMTLLK